MLEIDYYRLAKLGVVVTHLTDAGLGIALIRMTVAIARLADTQVEALDSSSVTNVAIFARKSSVADWTGALFDFNRTRFARVVLFGGVQRNEGKSEAKCCSISHGITYKDPLKSSSKYREKIFNENILILYSGH